MDMNQFRKSLAANQKINLNEVLSPDKEGVITLKNNKKIHLKVGDVVNIVDYRGNSYEKVTLNAVIDGKYNGLGGQVRFDLQGATHGMSGNGLVSITVVK